MADLGKLFEQLSQTPTEDIKDSYAEKEGITETDIENREKQDSYHLSKHIKRIKIVASWSVAIFLGGIFICFGLAFIWLFYTYISDVVSDISNVKELLKNWLDYVLLVMATLFAEKLFKPEK